MGIPTKSKQIEISPSKSGGLTTAPGVGRRLSDVENLTKAILWVGIISVVAVVVTCCTLVIDQMHFNNQTYQNDSSLNDARYKELTDQIQALTQRLDTPTAQTSTTKVQ